MEFKIMKVFKEWKKNTGYNYMMLFKFDYRERVLYIYTVYPGLLIGKAGKDIDVIKPKLDAIINGKYTIKFIETSKFYA